MLRGASFRYARRAQGAEVTDTNACDAGLKLIVANRHHAKAQALAEQFQGASVEMDTLEESVQSISLAVCAPISTDD